MATNHEEARSVPVNGIEMHVQISGKGDPLLLLHGFTGCGDDWRHVFDLGRRHHHHSRYRRFDAFRYRFDQAWPQRRRRWTFR